MGRKTRHRCILSCIPCRRKKQKVNLALCAKCLLIISQCDRGSPHCSRCVKLGGVRATIDLLQILNSLHRSVIVYMKMRVATCNPLLLPNRHLNVDNYVFSDDDLVTTYRNRVAHLERLVSELKRDPRPQSTPLPPLCQPTHHVLHCRPRGDGSAEADTATTATSSGTVLRSNPTTQPHGEAPFRGSQLCVSPVSCCDADPESPLPFRTLPFSRQSSASHLASSRFEAAPSLPSEHPRLLRDVFAGGTSHVTCFRCGFLRAAGC